MVGRVQFELLGNPLGLRFVSFSVPENLDGGYSKGFLPHATILHKYLV